MKKIIANQMRRDWDYRGKVEAMWYIASTRHDWTREDFFKSGEEMVARISKELFAPMEFSCADKTMLDIGLGIGRHTLAFAKVFREVYGTDVSPIMLEQADINLANQSNVTLSLSNGIDLGQYGDESVDFCFSHLVFMHIPEQDIILNYIREIGRVLKPNGLFWFDLSNARFARSKRLVFNLMAFIYKNTHVRLPRMSLEMLDPNSKIFQYETIDGAAPSLRQLRTVMTKANLTLRNISGIGTRIMVMEGFKQNR